LGANFYKKDELLNINLDRKEKRVGFLHNMFLSFIFLQNKKKVFKMLAIKRRMYKILYKTRIGLHFR
jgi:hypothetical protein